MAKVRTYAGKVVDFDEITRGKDNEQAVGNANMNARGDTINERGQITQSREERAREYNKNVTNSVIKSSLLDEVDDLPDIQKTKKPTPKTPDTPKASPKKSSISEDFDDIDGEKENTEDKKKNDTDKDGDKK